MRITRRLAAGLAIALVACIAAWFPLRSADSSDGASTRRDANSTAIVSEPMRAPVDAVATSAASDRRSAPVDDAEIEVAAPTEIAVETKDSITCRIELTGLHDDGRDIEVFLTAGRERETCTRQSNDVWLGRIEVTEADVKRKAVLSITTSSARYAWNWRGEPITAELVERGSFDCTMELRSGGSLTVRAASANGRAAAACKIWMSRIPDDPSSTTPAHETRPLLLDEHGVGTLTGMEPGRWAMTVDENHWWELAHASTEVKPNWNAEFDWILTELDRDEYTSGRVVASDPDGKCVHLQLLDESDAFVQDHAVEHGTFFLGASLGDELRVRAANRCTGARSEPITLRGGRHDHVIVLDR